MYVSFFQSLGWYQKPIINLSAQARAQAHKIIVAGTTTLRTHLAATEKLLMLF